MLPSSAGFQCKRREVQPYRPSFGAVEQLVHLGVSELNASGVEHLAPLQYRHGELFDSDLYDVSAGAKPRHREWWLRARPKCEPRAGRKVERKLGDRVEALVVLERLDMVEDEVDRLVHSCHCRRDP